MYKLTFCIFRLIPELTATSQALATATALPPTADFSALPEPMPPLGLELRKTLLGEF
jgi:hypothetical protein